MITLIEFTAFTCKYPIARTHEHLFCGEPSDGSWCDKHRRLVYGRGTDEERSAHRALKREMME